ncbi:hypothetical protein [Cellulomonas soli]|uniref:Uncharacterized protein n=1 Tax=Cellulomonas soli TaxID=931535 RepID=A0A512PHY7_9CELL|nr:hypothetical protein [Cellulomonas soli]NYI58814.1 hypothetical protein [Cellulomonas soli]GEP70806.1 hypothetical protein CSO01_35210 [Cellulomonas soli]
MARGFVHLNGVTYELAGAVDESFVGQVARRLNGGLRSTDDAVTGGTPYQSYDVLLDGRSVAMTIRLDRLWSAAAWLEEDGTA